MLKTDIVWKDLELANNEHYNFQFELELQQQTQ